MVLFRNYLSFSSYLLLTMKELRKKKDVQLAASVARLVYISNSTFLIYRGIICANRFV